MSNVIKMFGDMVGLSEERSKERQAIRELHQLSDRELSDLGMARSNIESTVRYGRKDETEKRAA